MYIQSFKDFRNLKITFGSTIATSMLILLKTKRTAVGQEVDGSPFELPAGTVVASLNNISNTLSKSIGVNMPGYTFGIVLEENGNGHYIALHSFYDDEPVIRNWLQFVPEHEKLCEDTFARYGVTQNLFQNEDEDGKLVQECHYRGRSSIFTFDLSNPRGDELAQIKKMFNRVFAYGDTRTEREKFEQVAEAFDGYLDYTCDEFSNKAAYDHFETAIISTDPPRILFRYVCASDRDIMVLPEDFDSLKEDAAAMLYDAMCNKDYSGEIQLTVSLEYKDKQLAESTTIRKA